MNKILVLSIILFLTIFVPACKLFYGEPQIVADNDGQAISPDQKIMTPEEHKYAIKQQQYMTWAFVGLFGVLIIVVCVSLLISRRR